MNRRIGAALAAAALSFGLVGATALPALAADDDQIALCVQASLRVEAAGQAANAAADALADVQADISAALLANVETAQNALSAAVKAEDVTAIIAAQVKLQAAVAALEGAADPSAETTALAEAKVKLAAAIADARKVCPADGDTDPTAPPTTTVPPTTTNPGPTGEPAPTTTVTVPPIDSGTGSGTGSGGGASTGDDADTPDVTVLAPSGAPETGGR